MQRLIDANALKDDILKSAVMIDDRGIQTGYEIAIELIKRQPTIDAVPVIRCKDCKYSVDEYEDGECYCKYTKCLQYVKDWNHYCSWAEPKVNK